MDNLLDILQSFSNDYSDLADELALAIMSNIKNGIDINKSVDSALESTDFVYNVEDSLISSVVDCFVLNYEVEDESELRDILMYTPWIGDLSLSERLDNISKSLSSQLKDTLNSNNSLINSLYDYLKSDNIDVSVIKSKISSISAFSDISDYINVNNAINKYNNDPTESNSKLIAILLASMILPIFSNIVNNILTVSYKDRYVGLNNTEGARANYEAMVKKTKNDANLFGYRWTVSPAHYRFPFDICDVNANSNVGYGKGVYRKDKVPIYPAHKHCICTITPVYKSELGNKLGNRFNDSGITDYINKLSTQDRNRLFSKQNLNRYNETKDYKLMYSYSGYESPTSRA